MNIPDVLMLNCIGSYFYSIFTYLNSIESKHSLLYYLSSGSLTYHSINSYSDDNIVQNPWRYQPVLITDEKDNALKINDDFFKYIYENYHILVKIIDMNYSNLLSNLPACSSYHNFLICNVDEYWNPVNTDFYQKHHNKHSFLIKVINYSDSNFEIIDSEKNSTYTLTFSEMERAVHQSVFKNKFLYSVQCESYKNNIIGSDVLETFLMVNHTTEYLEELKSDLTKKLMTHNVNHAFFYKGYYYNILSKVLPYHKMIFHLFVDNNIKYYGKSLEIVNEWKSLCNFMLFKMQKNHFDCEPVLKKLDKIISKEDRLYSCIKNL